MHLIGKQYGVSVAGAPGYIIEVAIPWNLLKPAGLAPKLGLTFKFAIGVNDSDQPGKRDCQLYYPRTWKHPYLSSGLGLSTFADAIIVPDQGK